MNGCLVYLEEVDVALEGFVLVVHGRHVPHWPRHHAGKFRVHGDVGVLLHHLFVWEGKGERRVDERHR